MLPGRLIKQKMLLTAKFDVTCDLSEFLAALFALSNGANISARDVIVWKTSSLVRRHPHISAILQRTATTALELATCVVVI
jgi:hypothetical protein